MGRGRETFGEDPSRLAPWAPPSKVCTGPYACGRPQLIDRRALSTPSNPTGAVDNGTGIPRRGNPKHFCLQARLPRPPLLPLPPARSSPSPSLDPPTSLESDFAARGTNSQYRSGRLQREQCRPERTSGVQCRRRSLDAGGAAARSVMCSYNSVNGIPACAHPNPVMCFATNSALTGSW